MTLLLAAFLALLSPPAATRWQTLDQNLAPFTERFNDYSDRYRLVMLVSPT
jgi:lipase chaperone LimK